VVDRKRPDRVVVGHDRHGVKTSGNPNDSFPSGHSVHIGAVVSALSWAFPEKAWALRAAGALVAGTRVAVLAHWSTDVLIGLTMGALLERGARRIPTSDSRKAIGPGSTVRIRMGNRVNSPEEQPATALLEPTQVLRLDGGRDEL
jgi:undecaprenyl-diphosphatase